MKRLRLMFGWLRRWWRGKPKPLVVVMPPRPELLPTLDDVMAQFVGIPIMDIPELLRADYAVQEWFELQGRRVPPFKIEVVQQTHLRPHRVKPGHWFLRVVLYPGWPTPPITADEFEGRTGRAPQPDDLARVNCSVIGEIGHWACGWCSEHNQPEFECMCRLQYEENRAV